MSSPEVRTQNEVPEPFPSLSSPPSPKSPGAEQIYSNRSREHSAASTLQGRLRSASKNFQESNPPTGMWIATGQIASSVPSLSDIRRGSYSSDGWSGEGQIREKERRASLSRRRSSQTGEERRGSIKPQSPKDQASQRFRHESVPEATEEPGHNADDYSSIMRSSSTAIEIKKRVEKQTSSDHRSSSDTPNTSAAKVEHHSITTPFDNGYQFPPKHKWTESTVIGLTAFWKVRAPFHKFDVLRVVYSVDFLEVDGSQDIDSSPSSALIFSTNARFWVLVLYHTYWISCSYLWAQRRGLGRNAVLALMQCITSDVQTHLQRY
jgi:hypothetical protein